jgi:hypothetical protein
MVTKPKLKGGLGVINLRVQNEALLMKNLHKFFNKENLPWVKLVWANYYGNDQVPGLTRKGSFWWRDNLKLLTCYKGIAQAIARSGDTIVFWQDLWNGRILCQAYHHLSSFTNNESITLHVVLQMNDLTN